ncbi:MAG: DNA repair protein RecN, partial [Clostridia bacterium]|nr:DNA repair protein RecN [Clostridia bacterium]
IIIDSINLLLGNRVSREIIRTGENTAVVSAVFEELSDGVRSAIAELGFDCEDGSLMLQRTLHRDGKSQTRLNGQTITQSMQREIARMLVSIHGQSDSQKLLQKSSHGALLDAYGHPDAEMTAYTDAYQVWKATCKKLDAVSRDEGEKIRLIEMLKFQISDIDSMKLKLGEEEKLIKERDRLLNLEKINRQVDQAYLALRGSEKGAALDLISRAQSALRGLNGIVDGVEELSDRLDAAASEILDIAESVLDFADDDREDPTACIDRMEERLEGIAKLKRKYGATVEDVLAFRGRAAEQLSEIELSDEAREKLQKEVVRQEKQVRTCAAALTAKRKSAAKEITKLVSESLAFLDMPKVRFDVRIDPSEPTADGADDIEFMIATNPGEPLLPMIRIASGGELSRIMLALRSVINDRDGAATVIFDEVDTGVSGKTARKVGIKLKETSRRAQVLCVTHSAQISSLADTHYLITKNEKDGRAETSVAPLTREERIEEIARILGGIEITDAQRHAAKEMLDDYEN